MTEKFFSKSIDAYVAESVAFGQSELNHGLLMGFQDKLEGHTWGALKKKRIWQGGDLGN